MIQRRIARRYAAAILNAARKTDAIDQVESDLGLVSYTLESSPSLARILRSPVIPRERKKSVIEEVFCGKLHFLTLSFLKLLVEKRREDLIPAIESEYTQLADDARGVVRALVKTAVEMSSEETARLAEVISRITGKTALLSTEVDPSIIGGVVVRIADTVIDGSIWGQLCAIRERLLGRV